MSDLSATPRRSGSGDQPQAEQLLRRVIEVIESARPMPLSSDSRINKEEVLELLNEALERLPDELRSARWLLKEREEFLAKVRREGDEILELARSRAERTVERTEIVRAAEQRARSIVDSAEAERQTCGAVRLEEIDVVAKARALVVFCLVTMSAAMFLGPWVGVMVQVNASRSRQ